MGLVVNRHVKILLKFLARSIKIEPARSIYETAATAAPITPKILCLQKILGFNRHVYWPCHFTSVIYAPQNIEIGISTAPGLSPNCYIQGKAGIKIGDYTLVGPGVGIISANHDIYDIHSHRPSKGVVIGKYCWLGMNAVILPGVRLGDHTIVAAGAIVTKSFPNGCCVLAGNPASVIQILSQNCIINKRNLHEYVGYYKADVFAKRKGVLLSRIYQDQTDSFLPPANIKHL
jgi:acetyltransferase-like isoleucine patch superfamily enzyme